MLKKILWNFTTAFFPLQKTSCYYIVDFLKFMTYGALANINTCDVYGILTFNQTGIV